MKITKEELEQLAENQESYRKVIQFVADAIWRRAGGDSKCLTVPTKEGR